MDNIKAFGDAKSQHNINERLNVERMKALRALDAFYRARNSTFKTAQSLTETKNSSKTAGLEESEYAPYTRCNNTNISDLIEENTINLDTSKTPARETNKISFEPAEMTGRSTQYKPDATKKLNKTITLEQILSSSCSEKVRCLGESIRTSYSNGSSLPRTADLSRSRTANTTATESNPGLSFTDCPRANDSAFCNESFAPAELMSSKLAAHEKEWEKEFAVMPAQDVTSKNTSLSSWNNGKTMFQTNDPNFSIGAYFQKGSEKIQNIITRKKSPTRHAPIPLIDDLTLDREPNQSFNENSFYARQAHDEAFNDVPLLKLNDSTFTPSSPIRTNSKNVKELPLDRDESEYSLSLSEIAEALNNIGTNESSTDVINKLLTRKGARNRDKAPLKQLPEKKDKNKVMAVSPSKPLVEKKDQRASIMQGQNKILAVSPTKQLLEKNQQQSCPCIIQNNILAVSPSRSPAKSSNKPENKENVDPGKSQFHLSETASFSESILELSDIRKEVLVKTPETSTSTASISPFGGENENFLKNNKVIRSPPISPNKFKQLPTYSETKKLPVHELELHKESRKRPFSSIRQTNEDQDILRNENAERRSPSPNPSFKTNSPTPSSRSFLSQNISQVTDRNCVSPNFDNSLVSERRFLVDSSSPECGKISLPSYGLVPRTTSGMLNGKWTLRSNSQCSTSSEYSHRDGCLPLKASCLEISWGSTKLRKNVKKSFKIKNYSAKRLTVQLEVTGPGFQLINHESQNLLTLQAQECRTIIVSFCPTVIGSAVGKLIFKPPCEKDTTFNAIFLYGYGGHANIIPHGICKGPVGSAFLTMGELNQLPNPLVSTFTVYNRGHLTGFAVVLVDSMGLGNGRDCIEVKPAKALIPPEGSVKFRVIFKPRKEDMKKIIKKISQVMTVGNLKIVCGDEPTRQRIQNLISKMKKSEKSKISSTSLDKVWEAFPNEMDIYDLNLLQEQTEVAHELISTLRTHDITLTLNHSNFNDTCESTLVFPDADETVMFRTIIAKSSSPAVSPNGEKTSELERQNMGTLKFQPSILEVKLFNVEKSYTITVRSFFSTVQCFQVECNYKNIFEFVPSRGKLDPGDCVEIDVNCLRQPVSSLEDVQIKVYVNNGSFTIPVKILKNPPQFS